MKRIGWIGVLILFHGCAHLRAEAPDTRERTDLWQAAHEALAQEQFGRADTLFNQLALHHAESEVGRESLFYVGALRLDPRNERFSAEGAMPVLRRYLALDTLAAVQIHRRPEGRTLLEIAAQLVLPAAERIHALQGPVVVERTTTPTVAPATPAAPPPNTDLTSENTRLRNEIALREARIRLLEDELERIRRTLSPAPR
jgi:hypothetical protein